MSSVNRTAYVLIRNGAFFTGKTNSGVPEYSIKMADAQGYSSIAVAGHFREMLNRLGSKNIIVRSMGLGEVVNV